MKMKTDDGLEWLREIRRNMAEEFENDPKKLGEHVRKLQQTHPERLYRREVESATAVLNEKAKPYKP